MYARDAKRYFLNGKGVDVKENIAPFDANMLQNILSCLSANAHIVMYPSSLKMHARAFALGNANMLQNILSCLSANAHIVMYPSSLKMHARAFALGNANCTNMIPGIGKRQSFLGMYASNAAKTFAHLAMIAKPISALGNVPMTILQSMELLERFTLLSARCAMKLLSRKPGERNVVRHAERRSMLRHMHGRLRDLAMYANSLLCRVLAMPGYALGTVG